VRGLDEVLGLERQALDEALRANPPGSPAADKAATGHAELDLLPDGLAERLGALQRHEFASPEAKARLEELMDKLRHDLAQLFLDRAAAAAAQAGPEQRAHLRDGLAALNRMLAQRAAGEELDPSFERFMERFGDLFPGASDLDELLEQLALRMAGASALLASMDAAQRAQLEQLAQELLSDLDLAWQLDQLAEQLRDAVPGLGWDQPIPGGQGPPLGLGEAGDLFQELAELGRLEQLLGSSLDPASLLEADPDAAARLLGPDAADSLEALAKLTRRLEEAGLVDRREGRLALTPRGLRRLGTRALDEVFGRLGRARLGDHAVVQPGIGHERSGQAKPYEPGDPFQLDIQETIRNAVVRNAAEVGTGGRVLPVRLAPDDFAVEQTEHASAAATVLAIDLSLSMPMRDNFLAAKKVAIALQALIASQYPRDYLGLVGFSATARQIKPSELPEVSWDFAYGTNLQHALALARKMLAHQYGTKQIICVTDGEPTAHIDDDGEVWFNYPPTQETLRRTMAEVIRTTKAG
ncbi:MAG: VWA domain-containing protein, partial [Acidimicrobiales bacterium]